MKKILYVNGCSHSCGSEITYPDSHRLDSDLEKSWAGQLATKFNLIHVNDGAGGQDNHSILSNTVHSILNLLENHKPEEIFVIIGWSGFERSYFIYEDELYKFLAGAKDFKHYPNWPDVVKRGYDSWVMGTDLNDDIYNKFSLIYLNMVNFLKSHNIDYYFFNAINPLYYPNKNLLHQIVNNKLITLKLFDQIQSDPNYLEPFNWDMTYYHYLSDRYDSNIGGRNHHFLPDAQGEWAEILAAKIQHRLG
jgi:hypothetical protein